MRSLIVRGERYNKKQQNELNASSTEDGDIFRSHGETIFDQLLLLTIPLPFILFGARLDFDC
ncbi:hypothetical protein LINGRAHAP2_LOCUS24244, partial [Linum grandiflorum]